MQQSRYGAKARFGVFPEGERWKLCCNAHVLGRFTDEAAATAAAMRAGALAIGSGFNPEIVRLVDGQLHSAPVSS
jgi:hypothetical protein